MSNYSMNITWSSTDEAFLVVVPELPGCMADGKTRSDAIINAERVIEEWLETARQIGRPIPQPRMREAAV